MFEKLARDIEHLTMEKLANRARELQRLGKLSRGATKELLNKGMLPSPEQVLSGMEQGNTNIRFKHNIGGEKDFADAIYNEYISDGVPPSVAAQRTIRDVKAVTDRSTHFALFTGGDMKDATPLKTYAIAQPYRPTAGMPEYIDENGRRAFKNLLKTNPNGRRMIDVISERHELDEARAMQRAAAKVSRSAGGKKRIADAKKWDADMAAYHNTPGARPPVGKRPITKILHDDLLDIGIGSEAKGQNHASPEVIFNEYANSRQLFPEAPEDSLIGWIRSRKNVQEFVPPITEISPTSRGGILYRIPGITPRGVSEVGDFTRLNEALFDNLISTPTVSTDREYAKLKRQNDKAMAMAESGLSDFSKFSPVAIDYNRPRDLIRKIRSLEDERARQFA